MSRFLNQPAFGLPVAFTSSYQNDGEEKMRKKTLIFILVIMGMFTFINAATMELVVMNGTHKNYFTMGVSPSIRLSNNLYLEGELFFLPRTGPIDSTHTEYIFEGQYVNKTRTSKTSATNLNISALYQLKFKSTQKWIPFLTAGGAV